MAAQNSSDDKRVARILKRLEEIDDRLNNVCLTDFAMRQIYHVTEFWRHIPFSPCDILNGKIIHKAFRDLCRLLSLSTMPSYKTLNLACLLSTQLRSPENHQSLLIDQEKFRPTFNMSDPYSVENFLITANDEKNFGQPGVNFMDFLSSVDKMDEEEAMIFGPAFASVVVTLKKCSGRTAANKIFFMKSNFEKFYPHSKITVRLPAKEVLIDILDKNKEANHDERLKNTVFLGCMYAYHKQDLNAETKEMLDALVLKSFRFTSMQLLTLVDEVTKAYGCSVDEYRQLTDNYQGNCSWRAYGRFMAEHGSEREPVECGQNDSFWMYAREFNHRVFQELTYNNNVWLCNFSADLLDLKLHSDKVKGWPVLGPTYHNLTKYKRSKFRLSYSEDHHKWALQVHDVLNALHHE